MIKYIFLKTICVISLLYTLIIPEIYSQETPNMKIAPLNPAFLKYQQQLKKRTKITFSNEALPLGLIPDPAIPEKHYPERDNLSQIPDAPLYDLRDPNNDGNISDCLLTPVRNQLSCGSCWSFATFGALESNLKINQHVSDPINDFSENHLNHRHQFDLASCSGGNMKMSAAYLLRYQGPIPESNDPYRPLTNEYCTNCSPTQYVDSVIFLPIRYNIEDIGYIKREVYHHGGIYSSLYFDENRYFHSDTSTYYYDDPDDSFDDSNHAIVIVGWNDNQIVQDAPGKGAFIVRNSFGSDWGENGYFYVSYYDESIAFTKLGYFEDHETSHFSFQNIYQYDDLGWTGAIGSGDGNDWAANVFIADENIEITGVGFYTTGSNMDCIISIYQQMDNENGCARLSNALLDQPIESSFEYSGYYIVKLKNALHVSSGNSFVVVINYSGLNNNYVIPIENPIAGYSSKATSKAGQSYVSDDGHLFIDLTDLSPNSNNCIKAYGTPFINMPPMAFSQEVQTNEDTKVLIRLSGTDQLNKGLNYFFLSYPSHGLISGHLPDLIYTPDKDYFGMDGFDFIVHNGTESSESAHITICIISVNDPPQLNFTQIQIDEDTSFSLSTIASDPDGDFVYCYIQRAPENGVISPSFPDRIYTPNANFFGQDYFIFYLHDGQVFSDNIRMNIDVKPINDKPLVFDQYITLQEDSKKRITLDGSDLENDHLVFKIENAPKHGGISGISPDLFYTPNPNYFGTDVFTYKANDGQIDSEIAYCYLTIKASNDQPTANDMTISLSEGQSVVFSLSGNDADNSPLSYIIQSTPDYGKLTGMLPDLTYTPNNGFHGNDHFTYQVDDGQNLSELASIHLIVTPNNEPPVVEDITISVIENTPKSITLVGTDPNSNQLDFSIVKYPEHGEIKGNFPCIIYVPQKDYSGVDKFTYKANDGFSNSRPGQVLIMIKHLNYPPEAFSERIIIAKNTAKRFYLNVSDKNNDDLSLTLVIHPKHGQLSGDFPFVTYTPDINFSGFDSFSFTVNDGLLNSNVAEVKIIVTEFKMVTDSTEIDTSTQVIFSEDFEGDTSEWSFGSDAQTNKWFTGTAVSYNGSKSAYISQDNGTTATYNEDAASESWLTRTVDLTGYIDANFSFYWKCVGERWIVWFDYGEFYINNDVLMSEAKEFINNTNWIQKSFNLTPYAGGYLDLKFKWINDGSQKNGDPAFCIDNLVITGTQTKAGAGNALDFDGSNDYVALSDGDVPASSIGLPATITVEAWVKVDTFIEWAGIVGFIYDDAFSEGGWVLGVKSENKFYFGITTKPSSSDYIYYLETGPDYSENTWYHVAGTYDGTIMRVYVNGIEVASLAPEKNGDIYYRNTDYVIGVYKDFTDSYEFDGQIDEVRIWDGARTPHEIRAYMCKKLDPYSESKLLDYFHLDHSQGDFVDDYKGENNNGILMNMDTNEDWVLSGAPLGNSSIYDYNGINANDFQVTLSHPDGDQITITGESGNYSGVHLYRIDKPPVNTTPSILWEPIHNGHSWGVFPVGNQMKFRSNYNYDGLVGVAPKMHLELFARDNHADTEWSALSSAHNPSFLLSSDMTPCEFILGIVNQAPNIIQGDAVSTIMDKNSWPREWNTPTITASDADNDPLTWTIFSGPSHGNLVVSGCGASPYINYTPTHDFVGYDSFVIQVEDDHDNSTDVITINVKIASGINAWNLPHSSPVEGANKVIQDKHNRIHLYHMGPGRMIMPPLK